MVSIKDSKWRTTDGRPLGTPDINELEKNYSIQRYTFVLDYDKNLFQDKNILDVGGGYGTGAMELVRRGANHIDCVDLNTVAIEYGQEHFSNPKIVYHNKDILEVKGSYDVVVAVELVEHLTTEQLITNIKHWYKTLTPNGYLYVTTPKRRLPKNMFPEGSHFTEYDFDEFRELVEPFGFKVVWNDWPENTDGISLAILFQKVR